MCPACIGSAVVYLASGASAGGFALLISRLFKRKHGRKILPANARK